MEVIKVDRKIGFFLVGVIIIVVSMLLNLVLLPLIIDRRISDLDYLRKDIELEIETLQSNLEKRNTIKLQSLILRTELDVLLSNSKDSPELLSERQNELLELENLALFELAKNVLTDSDLQEQEQKWGSMDYDQLQAEQTIMIKKLDTLILLYQEQMIANEQELTNELNKKQLLIFLAPSVLIIGTIITQYSKYLGKKESSKIRSVEENL